MSTAADVCSPVPSSAQAETLKVIETKTAVSNLRITKSLPSYFLVLVLGGTHFRLGHLYAIELEAPDFSGDLRRAVLLALAVFREEEDHMAMTVYVNPKF